MNSDNIVQALPSMLKGDMWPPDSNSASASRSWQGVWTVSHPVTSTSPPPAVLWPLFTGVSLPSTHPLSTRKESRQTLSFFFKWNLENKQVQLPICRAPVSLVLSTGSPYSGPGGSH